MALQTISSQVEASVLSTCLSRLDSGWFSHVGIVGGEQSQELFGIRQHRTIFEAIGSIYGEGRVPTLPMILDRVNEYADEDFEDPQSVIDQIRLVPPVPDLDAFDNSLEELSQKRSLRQQMRQLDELRADMSDDSTSVVPEDIAKRLQEIVNNTDVRANAVNFADLTKDILETAAPSWAQSTGYPSFDNVLGGRGFKSGTFTVIAARPKVGKTILMNQFVNRMLDGGAYPVVLNFETQRVEFVSKIISSHLATPGIYWSDIELFLSKDPNFTPSERQESLIREGLRWASEQKWYVSFDQHMSQQDIHALVVKSKAEMPDGTRFVLFVDYLQLQVKNAQFAQSEITDWTKFYKKLAMELDIAVVCLAQMNRNDGDDKPRVHNLKGSGSIEQDADTILLLDKPSRTDPSANKNILNVYAGTTRVASGDDFDMYMDAGANVIHEMTDDIRREAMEYQQEHGDYDSNTLI